MVKPKPIKLKVKQIVWLLSAMTVVVLVIGYFQMQAMSAVRAYVLGESLWAKAQRDAVSHLKEYIQNPSDHHFTAFKETLHINLSDKQARLALQQTPPDIDVAYDGLIGGGNHPEDVPGMIRLFIWFQDLYPMKQAIEFWVEGDREIENLQQLAHRIRSSYKNDPQADLNKFRPMLDELNVMLNRWEVDFSNQLSEGARWLKNVFMLVNILLLIGVVLLVALIARKVIRDIDETESELRISESRFKALYDSNVIGIIVWGTDGDLYDANDKFLDMMDYNRSDLILGRINWRDATPVDWQQADEYAMNQIAEQGWCLPFNKEYFDRTGNRVPVFVGGAVLNGTTDRGVAFVVDRTHEKEMESQLRLSATVLEASRDAILICDDRRLVLKANEAFYKMKGVKPQGFVGKPVDIFHLGVDETDQSIEDLLSTRGYWQGDVNFPTDSGRTIPVRASISTVKSPRGNLNYYVAVYTDISIRKAFEDDLKVQAHYDHLTGLANRSLYSDRLNTAIARAERHQQECALLFIDLDKFKPVNDKYGHQVGDLLLQEVAERMLVVSRKSDTVGRLGGDEFVVIIEELSDTGSVQSFAEKIIYQIEQPFFIQDHRISIGCSIGAAVYPDHGRDVTELTRSADIAMYAAKASMVAKFYLFTTSDQEHST